VLRVAIVDDHPVARQGLTAILAAAEDLTVTCAVEDCTLLPRNEAGKVDADLVILDLYLANGEPALAAISELSDVVPVLVVSASRKPIDVLAAMQAGASGYVTKQTTEEGYLTAIRSIATGGFHLSAQLADLIQAATLSSHPTAAPAEHERLSRREQEALGFVARGFTHQQTASRMGVSKSTVDTYITRIRGKLHLGNKAELTMAALRYLGRAQE
jgi:DNA-binding NarL/FixJ family response regulator